MAQIAEPTFEIKMTTSHTERDRFFAKLKSVGVTVQLDETCRKDGKRLENYAFVHKDWIQYVIEDVVNRNWGQSYYFKQEKNTLVYVKLTDKMYYENLFDLIMFNKNLKKDR